MPLSNLEQLRIASREVSPEAASLDSLVKQAAVNFGADFYTTYTASALATEADGSFTNEEAAAYVNKILSGINTVFRADGTQIARITNIVIALIGNVAPNINAVINATDEQWDGFVTDQIDEVLELFSGVRQNEKAAYLAL